MSRSARPQPLSAPLAKQLEAAQGLLRTGNAAVALGACRSIVMQAPQAPDAHLLLAMCLSETGTFTEAEQSFLRALELAPSHPLILLNFATSLRKSGRAQEALEILSRTVAVAPSQIKGWIELGHTALGLGQIPLARSALERAVLLQPDSTTAWQALGHAQKAGSDFESAEFSFRRAIALAPKDGAAWFQHGAMLRMIGRPDQALACFDHAATLGYVGADLIDARSGTLLDCGHPEESLREARRVVGEFPEFAAGHVTLAHLLWEYGATLAPGCDPIAVFREATEARPLDSALRLEFARILMTAQKADEALDHIRILRADSDRPMLKLLEANALEALGQSEQSGVLYAELDHSEGDRSPTFLNAYTRHLLKAGKWDLAAERAQDATRISPTDQEAWAYLATAWRLIGDEREHWLCNYNRLITLIEIDPPKPYTDIPSFLAALENNLMPLHLAKREPVQQSLRSGSQTPGRLFGRKDAVIEATASALKRGIEGWLKTLPSDDTHPFLRYRMPSIRFSGSWSVRLWSSGCHVNHMHPEGWMSSAFYVALPASVTADSARQSHAGYIQFGQPPIELGLNLNPRRIIRPQAGHLALFPSYMWHGTVPFEDEAPRITVAFDMVPSAS